MSVGRAGPLLSLLPGPVMSPCKVPSTPLLPTRSCHVTGAKRSFPSRLEGEGNSGSSSLDCGHVEPTRPPAP